MGKGLERPQATEVTLLLQEGERAERSFLSTGIGLTHLGRRQARGGERGTQKRERGTAPWTPQNPAGKHQNGIRESTKVAKSASCASRGLFPSREERKGGLSALRRGSMGKKGSGKKGSDELLPSRKVRKRGVQGEGGNSLAG